MPNVKVLPEDHKRIVTLTGELMVKWERKVYLFETVKFLLDFYEQNTKVGLSTMH